jgi:hypothetical protein
MSGFAGKGSKGFIADDAASKSRKWFDAKGNIRWPPNDGFIGTPKKAVLPPGTKIDRYGYNTGSFVSPKGTSYGARSLAPDTNLKPYRVFEVLKPINVLEGKAAPWFDEIGGGTQFKFGESVEELINGGYLKEIKK